MDNTTPLDAAHERMQAAPEDATARLRFYEHLSGTMLHLLLEAESETENVTPRTFEIDGEKYVLAFDSEARLVQFTQAPAPHASLTGRALAEVLGGRGLGLALNPDVAPSEILLPSGAVAWLAQMLRDEPDRLRARPEEMFAPNGLPEELLVSLDTRLAKMEGLAERAYLAGVRYEDGGRGHLLGILGAPADAQPALARAVSEALSFSGVEAAALDVAFFQAHEPITATLARHGLRFDIPSPSDGVAAGPSAPGMDPEKPPLIR